MLILYIPKFHSPPLFGFGLSDQDCDQVMRNLGKSRDVECYTSNYNDSIRLRTQELIVDKL
jgi:hypothetical protein